VLQLRIKRQCDKKLKKLKANVALNKKNSSLESEYLKLWKKLGKKPQTLFLNLMRSINGIDSIKYVPEDIHYGIIEPILNNKAYALTFNDKNFFERYLPRFKGFFPVTILRGINGVIHDADFKIVSFEQTKKILTDLQVPNSLILKPATETGGGANVMLIKKLDKGFEFDNNLHDTEEFVRFLNNQYKNDFVLQYKINQSQWFRDFNETSLNTVRMYTYRSVKDETVYPIRAYVRFGIPGSLIDSSSQGGRTCGISREGILNNFALGRYAEKYVDLDCVKQKGSTKIPYWDKMVIAAKEIASSYHYHRLLGFDFSVDEDDNIRLMEVNTLIIGVINQQMNSGPLFQEFTNEVIDYCNSQKKSIILDFYV